MEAPSSSRKRPFFDNDDADTMKPMQKRIRFPKGKKVKAGTELEIVREEKPVSVDFSDPRVAAKERARRRSQMTTQLFTEDGDGDVDVSRISVAEVRYQENDSLVDDGIKIEPFNLEQEREEGFFDESGNYVEYAPEKEEKDAWLDSVEFDPKLAKRIPIVTKNEDEVQDLSLSDVCKIKRRIANTLEPGETVLQALKRLKGRQNDKKAKMSAATKGVFDQLTEDAMRLLENGEYDVYHEKKEIFEREAEGYEALARARNNDVSGDDEAMDMFGDEDVGVAAKSENKPTSVLSEATNCDMATGMGSQDSESSWAGQSDCVYDETSGYYYSSSLGYYYDPSTGLFCCATSGLWYKYNEDSGTYDEVQADSNTTSTAT